MESKVHVHLKQYEKLDMPESLREKNLRALDEGQKKQKNRVNRESLEQKLLSPVKTSRKIEIRKNSLVDMNLNP